jgi:putative ABC transport system permease protein
MKGSQPPSFAEWLLAITLRDPEWRACIVGDLREEFCAIAARQGVTQARRWYWRQTLAIGSRSVTARLGSRRTLRSWVAPPESEGRGGWGIGFTRELRHAWRTLARRPVTSAVIVVTLGLSLAVNSAVFALVDALLLRPFRFPDIDRIVMVTSDSPQDPLPDRESVAAADFRDWRSEARTISYFSAAEWWDANLSGIDEPEQVPGYRVTADFFKALGMMPIHGRDFTRDEETPGQHRRAVLGHALWQRRFASDPGLVGRTIRLDGEPYEVVGIAPPRFAVPDGAQIWAPLSYTAEQWNDRRRGYLNVFGRLANGVSIEQARAEMGSIVARQQRDYRETNATRPVTVTDFTRGMADPGSGPFILSVQVASLLLMIIACANVANLLLARGSERTHEYAMRLALGAGRARLAWQTLLEGAVLAVLSVLLAVPIGFALIGLTRASIPAAIIRFIPGFDYLQLSPAVFAATAVAAAVATMSFAVFPAVYAARSQVSDGLRHGSRTMTSSRERQWVRSGLATAQVAITLSLLFGSVLATRAAHTAVEGAFGFDKRDLLVARLMLPERPYTEPQRRRQFIDGVLDRMRTIPAVESAAMVSNLPYAGGNTVREFWPEGALVEQRSVQNVDFRRASPDYFSTMRIPVLAGRGFTDADRGDTLAVAIVSKSLVDRYWPGQDPLGKRFKIAENGAWIVVVGVVGDVLHDWFLQRRASTVYRPLAQDAPFAHAFVVRTVGNPDSVAGDLRRAVTAVDPDQPVMELQTMDAHIVNRTSGLTFVARALGLVALIAFALAMTGVYSLMTFIASRRAHEIGVRIALGAGWWQVIRLSTAQAVRITLVGTTVGVVLAIAMGQALQSSLNTGLTTSLWYLAGLTVVQMAVALAAAYVPARRAASIDPTSALRAE